MSPRTIQVILAIVLGGSSLFSTTCTAQLLQFGCYPNSTFILLNPGDFKRVFAYDSKGICTTTWSADRTTIALTNCHMDTDIVVNFNNLNESYDITILATSNKYLIRCVDVPAGGVVWNVGNKLAVGVGIKQNVTVTFPIRSNIYEDSAFTQLAREELVGTPLFWHIQGDPAYHLRPLDCWAYSGKVISDLVPKKLIYKDGCTDDINLTGNFKRVSGTNGFRVYSDFIAFKFYGSDYVTLKCTVQVCKAPSTFCNIGCGFMQTTANCYTDCPNRKRRSIGDGGISADEEFTSVTVTSPPLRIVHVEDILSGSTSVGSSCLWITLAWLILKVFCREK